MTGLEEVLRRAAADLDAVGARWAIIGGLAVATRAARRFTQDVDFAVSVADDAEAEDIVHRVSVRGYAVGMMLEQDYVHRLATISLIRPVPGKSQVFVDLLFGSSGIEDQVVACADRLEVWPGFSVPVARVGHLRASRSSLSAASTAGARLRQTSTRLREKASSPSPLVPQARLPQARTER